MKIKNKPMFYTGLSFQLMQIVAVAIFLLSLLNWSWFTLKVFTMLMVCSAVIMFNVISGLLMKYSVEWSDKRK